MIITCPECTTRFNVAEERIPEAGAKVRCARCKHVFLAHKPGQEEPVEITTEDAFIADPVSVTDSADAAGSPVDDNTESPFHREPVAERTDPADFSDVETADDDFDYDRFRELDTDNAPIEEFTFGSEEDELPAPTAAATDTGPDLSAPPDADSTEQDEARELAVEAPEKKKPTTAPKNSAFSILIKAMLLIILAALIGAGAIIYLDGPEEINEKIRQYFGQVSKDPVDIGEISLGTLDGRFLTNEQAGEIFVIRGDVINNFSQPRSAIQVKGVLHDQHGKPLKQKTVFSGNPISDEALRTLPFEEIEQLMGNQFGKDLSNMKIDPRRSIPFAIVFKDLPQNIAEFSVKVTSSRPTSD